MAEIGENNYPRNEDQSKDDEKYQSGDEDENGDAEEKQQDDLMDEPGQEQDNTTFGLDPPEFKLVRKQRQTKNLVQQSQAETEETEEDMELSKLFGKYNIAIKERDGIGRKEGKAVLEGKFGIKKRNAPELFKRLKYAKPGRGATYRYLFFDEAPIRKVIETGEDIMSTNSQIFFGKAFKIGEIRDNQKKFDTLFKTAVENYQQSTDSAIQEAVGVVLPGRVIDNIEDNVLNRLKLQVDSDPFLKSISENIGKLRGPRGKPGKSIRGEKGEQELPGEKGEP